ncbi:hypothetical protein ACFC36_20045 [Streptomyces rubiginosohelvolus]|uniref:hypothetical protein n=1 Tax=Streptomyces rubiginosohelvolus TaxID=67362 RepID=UPI0035D9C8F3
MGITDDLVQQLAEVGQVNNYGLIIEQPMTEFEKQGLAIGQMMNCQGVNAGDRTYEELMQEHMSTGAHVGAGQRDVRLPGGVLLSARAAGARPVGACFGHTSTPVAGSGAWFPL